MAALSFAGSRAARLRPRLRQDPAAPARIRIVRSAAPRIRPPPSLLPRSARLAAGGLLPKLLRASTMSTPRHVFELLEVVQFTCLDTSMKYPQLLSNLRVESKIEEILRNSATSEFGSVYYFSERGGRPIDLDAFHQKLIQMSQDLHTQLSEYEKGDLKEPFHHMLEWARRYNKILKNRQPSFTC